MRYLRLGGLLGLAILFGCAGAPTPDVRINQSFRGTPANDEPAVACSAQNRNACVAGFHERFELPPVLPTHVITANTTDGGVTWGNDQVMSISCGRDTSTSFDPWISSPEGIATADLFQVAFVGQCRSSSTSEVVGFARAAYHTSADNGRTWSSAEIISPDGGNADKTHVYATDKGPYISYVFFGAGEVRVYSTALHTALPLGFGGSPVTLQINDNPPTTITAYVANSSVGMLLKIGSIAWGNPLSPPAPPVAVLLVKSSPIAQTACSGAIESTVPGTRIRHNPIPQIAKGGSPLRVYIAINNYNIFTNQYELHVWHFNAGENPAAGVWTVHTFPGKNVISPALAHDGSNLIATFYLQDISHPYDWNYMKMTMDQNAQQVGELAQLNTTSPLNFFGAVFVGDYMNVAARAGGGFYAVWTDPRNHSAASECPAVTTVGTDIYGRGN